MEELLPLESYHVQSDRTLRRLAMAAGSAFGLVMGSATGFAIASATGLAAGAWAGLAAAGITGSAFAVLWGGSMVRLRRADNERVHDNDPELMGESLEDSYRYRMPCSLMHGRRLVAGTLYLDRDRGAFVPIRKLAKSFETTRFSVGPSPFHVMPWQDAPRWEGWKLGAPAILKVASDGQALRFITPDSDLAMARLRELLR